MPSCCTLAPFKTTAARSWHSTIEGMKERGWNSQIQIQSRHPRKTMNFRPNTFTTLPLKKTTTTHALSRQKSPQRAPEKRNCSGNSYRSGSPLQYTAKRKANLLLARLGNGVGNCYVVTVVPHLVNVCGDVIMCAICTWGWLH